MSLNILLYRSFSFSLPRSW